MERSVLEAYFDHRTYCDYVGSLLYPGAEFLYLHNRKIGLSCQ